MWFLLVSIPTGLNGFRICENFVKHELGSMVPGKKAGEAGFLQVIVSLSWWIVNLQIKETNQTRTMSLCFLLRPIFHSTDG